ncbi:MAG TPA: ABC transporter permease subunit [Sumerlaeia bacterium]|nr:ABC transporter permease subunit [Sumerlaeia bacterium]
MHYVRAIIFKELRTILRSPKAFFSLLAILAASGGAFWVFWMAEAGSVGLMGRVQFSRTVFLVLNVAQICALGLIAPVMTATVVTGEREGKTLEMLYCTRIPRFHILLGKWLATILFQLILIVCLLPILTLSFQLGGVGLDEFLFAAAMTSLTVLTYGMIGLACSTRFRRTTPALFVALAIVLFLGLGVPLGLVILDEMGLYDLKGVGLLALRMRGLVDHLIVVSPAVAWVVFSYDYFEQSATASLALADLFTSSTFLWHLFFQSCFFFAAAFLGWKGLARADVERAVVARKPIDDPGLLERRRKRFPYYLIDPLRRARPIQDNQNPAYVKELRTATLGKMTLLIRMTYAVILLSFFVAYSLILASTPDAAKFLATWTISVLLLFIPILAATSVTREREEGTMDLLRTTTLDAGAIVRAKLRVALRFLAVLGLSLAFIPTLSLFLLTLFGGSIPGDGTDAVAALEALLHVLAMAVPTAAFVLFYASLCVFCSALFRRNVTAVVVSYIFIGLLIISPAFLTVAGLAVDDVFRGAHMGWLGRSLEYRMFLMQALTGPFLSPYFYWFPDGWSDRKFFLLFPHWSELRTHWWDLRQIVAHAAVLLAASWAVLKLAALRLEKGFKK